MWPLIIPRNKMPKEGATITEIQDMGEVAEDDLPIDSITIKGAVVVGVLRVKKCIVCKGKVEGEDDNIGSCRRCVMQQCIESCKEELNVKSVINSGQKYHTLNEFGSNVTDILCQTTDVTARALLRAPPFSSTYR